MDSITTNRLVDVFDRIANAIFSSAQHLGVNNAMPPMGAIELLSLEIKQGSERIANGLHAIANAIENREETDG